MSQILSPGIGLEASQGKAHGQHLESGLVLAKASSIIIVGLKWWGSRPLMSQANPLATGTVSYETLKLQWMLSL